MITYVCRIELTVLDIKNIQYNNSTGCLSERSHVNKQTRIENQFTRLNAKLRRRSSAGNELCYASYVCMYVGVPTNVCMYIHTFQVYIHMCNFYVWKRAIACSVVKEKRKVTVVSSISYVNNPLTQR